MTLHGCPDGGYAREVLRELAALSAVGLAEGTDSVVLQDHLAPVVLSAVLREHVAVCPDLVFDDDGPHLVNVTDCPDSECGALGPRLIAIGGCSHGVEVDLDVFGGDLEEAIRLARRRLGTPAYVADGWN